MISIRLLILAIFTMVVCTSARADINVFAAASTAGALERVAKEFSNRGLGVARVSYAASSTLAKQIVNGAPAEIFLSASSAWMDYVSRRGAITPSTRIDLLGNRLLLVAPRNTNFSVRLETGFPLAKALGDSYLAMGDPDHVPVGIYGKAALEALGVWKSVEGRIARAANARAALALVERGEVAAGIVYRSDIKKRNSVRVVATLPLHIHPPIRYSLAIVTSRENPEATAFLNFVKSPAADDIFVEFGFDVIHD
jgi:molybdate transport system substrate-binding protein